MTWTLTNNHHVIPDGDLRDHEASSECWCHPMPDEQEAEVIVHNALDGRELYERGERKVS